FPGQLPFGKHMFLQGMMCFDNDKRGCSLKSYPAFNTYNRITHMNISANPEWCSYFMNCLNSLCRMRKMLTIYLYQFSFVKIKCKLFGITFSNRCRKGFFR